jgi:hypothetical protein
VTDLHATIDDLADSEIRRRLLQRGVHERVVEMLIQDRETAGARWRIADTLDLDE